MLQERLAIQINTGALWLSVQNKEYPDPGVRSLTVGRHYLRLQLRKFDDIWAGLHSELGIVIYDPTQIVKGGKYQFKLWSHARNEFVSSDRATAREKILSTPTDPDFLSDLKSAVEQYQQRNVHGSLYWTGTAGPNDPVLAGYDSSTGDPNYVPRSDGEKEEYSESELYEWGETLVDRYLDE